MDSVSIERLKEIYAKVLGGDMSVGDVGEDDLIRRHSIDSILSLELLIHVEDQFGIQFDDEELSPELIDSLGTLVRHIAAKSG